MAGTNESFDLVLPPLILDDGEREMQQRALWKHTFGIDP